MPSRKIVIGDIVNMAGVTKSTISRYFNGGSVEGSTRERIREIIREHSYKPDTLTRLKTKGSSVIKMVLPTLNSKISSQVMTSIGHYPREQGYETLIKDSDRGADLEPKNIQRPITLKVDGVVLSAIIITGAHRNLVQESSVPVVMAAQEYDGGISIIHDGYGAGKTMGIRVGRVAPARVGYMGVSGLGVAVGPNHRQDVMDGLKEYGVKNVITATGGYSYANGIRMAEEVLGQGPVDAIICATNRLVFGAYHVLGERGLRIPKDVSVAGFGGCDESTLLEPKLTTLRFDSCGLGYLGIETILKMIHRESVPEKQIVDYRIIEGGSVKR